MFLGHSGTVYDLALMTLVDTTRVISASYDGSLRVSEQGYVQSQLKRY